MVMQKEMETRRQPLYVLGERPAGLQRELEIRRGLVGTNPARREKLMDEGMWEKWKSGKRGNCRELQRQMEWKASQWGGDTRLLARRAGQTIYGPWGMVLVGMHLLSSGLKEEGNKEPRGFKPSSDRSKAKGMASSSPLLCSIGLYQHSTSSSWHPALLQGAKAQETLKALIKNLW